jgi:hypothetical protein
MLMLDAVRSHLSKIERDLDDGLVFEASLNDHALRESLMQCVLRPMLPQRYGLAQGVAFSVDDNVSQPDAVLIFDANYALPLGAHFPCETVFAMCDVQREINADTLMSSVQTIASLKRLRREKATAHDVSPLHHLGVFGARYAQLSDDLLNPYLGYIFAEDSIDQAHLLEQLNDAIRSNAVAPEHTPDAIFCFKCGWAIVRQTRTGFLSVPRTSFVKFGLWEPKQHLLTFAYLLLNLSLSRLALRGPDLMRPMEQLLREMH